MKDMLLILFCIFNLALLKNKEADILEIPLKQIRVKGIPKYSHIVFEDPEIDDNQDNDIILRASGGQAIL